jgi:hypothetical protein
MPAPKKARPRLKPAIFNEEYSYNLVQIPSESFDYTAPSSKPSQLALSKLRAHFQSYLTEQEKANHTLKAAERDTTVLPFSCVTNTHYPL